MNGKTVFIIPGFKHTPKNRAYKKIAKMLKDEGYSPVLVTIPWKHSTLSQNADYFLKQYKKIKTRKKYILGFSFGAMIAFVASTKVSSSGVILCSLSPYFKEDGFLTFGCKSVAKRSKAKQVHMLYGTHEAKSLIKRVREAYEYIPSSQKHLVPIRMTEHNIGDKRYLHTIARVAKLLN
ncbi:MAG TPA: hypothetical protein VLF68_01085 [Candidatus Saccharimonadales bacterium]|nr:hypothetical protein [Candidatus Saccharimonadales bacterium]